LGHFSFRSAVGKRRENCENGKKPRRGAQHVLSSIRDPNPVIFLEPKILYRSAVEDVPLGDYELLLGKARIAKEGSDVPWSAGARPSLHHHHHHHLFATHSSLGAANTAPAIYYR
jgi:2-oxoisovalerate dehydrogenase E1 component beta subunit